VAGEAILEANDATRAVVASLARIARLIFAGRRMGLVLPSA